MTLDFSQDFKLNHQQAKTKFEQEVLEFLAEWYSESTHIGVKSSGSTSQAKQMMVEKQQMLASAQATCLFLGLHKGDTALLCLPVEYISGKMMLVRAIWAGLKITVVTPSLNPLQGLDQRFDFVAMSPLQVENSLENLSKIQQLIIGGAAVSENLKNKLIPYSTKVYETYGMTETLSHIALKRLQPEAQEDFELMPKIAIYLSEGQTLVISAPHLCNENLITNDLVKITSPTTFRFIGRQDFVINSGGIKINPETLEKEIKRHLQPELILFGLEDESLGQKMCLAIEGDFDADILAQYEQITWPEKWQKAKQVYFIHQFPRTPNGKILRREIAKLAANI